MSSSVKTEGGVTNAIMPLPIFTNPKPAREIGKDNLSRILSGFKLKQVSTTTMGLRTKESRENQGTDSIEESTESKLVRRSRRNAVLNTQARIQQCQIDDSDEDSQGYDTEDSSYLPENEATGVVQQLSTELTTSQQQQQQQQQQSLPTEARSSDIVVSLATKLHMSPSVNITKFDKTTLTRPTTTTTRYLTTNLIKKPSPSTSTATCRV